MLYVSRQHQHFQSVNLAEFESLCISGTRHTSELAVNPEVILEGGGSQCLALTLNINALFCLNGLMQTFGQTPPSHGATSVLVNQHYLAILNNVFHIALEQHVGPKPRIHVVQQVEVCCRVKAIALFQQLLANHHLFDELMTRFGQLHLPLLLIDSVVSRFVFKVWLERRNQAIDFFIQL